MKKIISILLLITTMALCLASCGKCETCDGNETIMCRACYGRGKETCDMCFGNGDCDDCANGIVKDAHCSNSNCNYGYVTTSFGRLECQECDGTGYEERECYYCDGSGQCFKCDGTGLKENAQTCSNCEGNGRIDCPNCE